MADTVLESIKLLARGTDAFVEFCIADIQANAEICESFVEKSLSMVTSLNEHVGYEMATSLAKEAFKTDKTIRELCMEKEILDEATLNDALDPMKMTEPQE